jgi:glycosyltransferase involved in cell wall biosynthesis
MVGPGEDERAGGMRDYTNLLSDALRDEGVEVTRIASQTWALRDLRRLRSHIREADADLVHMQHPLSYGRRMAPQALALVSRAVVTIHEASIFGRLESRALTLPFTVRTRALIFTSEYERRFVARGAPWTRGKATVIPVPSNIPALPPPGASAHGRIVHFGVIRPGKGIEEVIRLGELIQERGLALRVRIVGETQYERYAARMRAAAAGLPIEWVTGLDAEGVATELGQADVAYFPLPDGVSERRSTVLAALGNGCPVVTTAGGQTTEALRRAVTFASTPEEALRVIDRLMNDEMERKRMVERGRSYYAAVPGWPEVARRHIEVYREILGR